MFLLVDKPKGITSHDAIVYIRKILRDADFEKEKNIKIGHSGTLDPAAEGLLIIGVGRDSTKKLRNFTKLDKVYEGKIFLGAESSTDDSEGIIISKSKGLLAPGLKEVGAVVKSFYGKKKQTPPKYSAIKIRGKKAYQLARKGKEIQLKPREITIYWIKLLDYSFPIITFRTKVSSGTYIRALARDIGRKLGCGAYLKDLKRISIGNFRLEKSTPLNLINSDNYRKFLVDLKI